MEYLRFRSVVGRENALTSGSDVDESAPDSGRHHVVIDIHEITDSLVQDQSAQLSINSEEIRL